MITIVTDSSSYFKKAEARDLGVRVIPINYSVNGHNYSESFSDQNGDFESLLKVNGKFTTTHPSIFAFLGCFEEELSKNNQVLCITISSHLSGTYNAAYSAAKQINSDGIAVLDSHFAAGGLYLLIKEARKFARDGLSLVEIVQKLLIARDKIIMAFSVDDITPLRNSGRIRFVRMSMGTILNIKPILICSDGAVVSDGIARGSTEIIKKLTAKINADAQEVVISYIGDNRLAANLYHVVRGSLPLTTITLQKVGPILGIHLGLRAVAISIISS